METLPSAVGVGDRRDGGPVTDEDPADSARRLRAEGNCACLVHRRAERADRRESAVSVRDYLHAPLALEERALTAARELAVEAPVPRVV
jgi:hypothetical protein